MISISDIKNGDETVFTGIFHAYYARVYHYFLKKMEDTATAKELAQLTFIKLWQNRPGLSDQHPFDAQLFRIASTVMLDHLRREYTWRRKLKLAGTRVTEETAFAVTKFEADDYLNSLTQTLPPVRKKVFILHRIHGRSYKEIAEQLSISIRTVEDHMTKALRHIRSSASHLFLLFLFWWLS